MTIFTRPMKAEEVEDWGDIQYSVIGTPKVDGIRALRDEGSLLSSTLKPIPNTYTRKVLSKLLPDGVDGELTPLSGDGNFQRCTSYFMTQKGEPSFTYWLFDYIKSALDAYIPYADRLVNLHQAYERAAKKDPVVRQCVRVLPHQLIHNEEELRIFLQVCLELGFKEGIIIRAPGSPYKFNRSTVKEGYCLKIKYRKDSEAEIIGFVEQNHNVNKAKKDERGLTKRSSAKAGKVPAGTLGSLLVRDVNTGIEFEIGTGKGLDKALRQEIWDHRKKYLHKLVKYSYQPVGVKEKPRQPSLSRDFLGIRDRRDL